MYIFVGVDLILRKLLFRDEDEKCSYLFNNIKITKQFYRHITYKRKCYLFVEINSMFDV